MMIHRSIKGIRTTIRFLRLRTRWTAHPDRDEWHRGAWLIEGGEANYGLFHPHRQTSRHLTLMAAMETAERADSVQFVFRSRQGDIRDTAAAMTPDLDENGDPK